MKLLLPLVLTLLAVTGCASDAIQPKVRQQLAARAAELKTAALAHDRNAADTALTALHSEIANAVSAGKLDSDAAGEIMIVADRVAEDVRTPPASAAPVTVTAPARPHG